MRGISLEEISASTKIGTRSLRAIEEEDFEKLPGGIFNKGFVRAYSRFLGLDEEQTVSDFDAAWNDYEASRGPTVALPAEEEKETQPAKSAFLLVVALIILGAIAAGWYLLQRRRQQANSSSALVETSQANSDSLAKTSLPAASVTQPAGSGREIARPGTPMASAMQKAPSSLPGAPATSIAKENQSSSKPTASHDAASAPIRLQVFAREDSWLSVSVDGKDLGQGILNASKSRSIHAQKEVRLKVGNLAGVQVSFNGEAVDVDGEPKQVKELIFTAEGLQR